jgi:uncharacterized repeat protein (TIGR03803 family)
MPARGIATGDFHMRFHMRLRLLAVVVLVLLGALASGSAQAWRLRTIYSFCPQTKCLDGAYPGGIALDENGNIYGTADGGGDQFEGVVFKASYNLAKDKWSYKRLWSFCGEADCPDGLQPVAAPIRDTSGNLYGTTVGQGPPDADCSGGTAFKLTPRGKLSVLHRFPANSHDGGCPYSDLTYAGAASGAAYDGVSPLYGTTLFGGSGNCDFGCGTVFELAPVPGQKKWSETVLYRFCGCNGDSEYPNPGLLIDAAGNIYGTEGGNFDYGTIFKLALVGGKWKETILYRFCSQANCSDGRYPYDGHLLMDSSGALIGTANSGGQNGKGVVFKFAPATQQYTVLHDFCSLADCADGAYPSVGLILDGAGNLFGTTKYGGGHDNDYRGYGGGTVFELSGTTLTTLYSFCAEANCADGAYPDNGLILDGAGNLFSTTVQGGIYYGTVFELRP